MACIADSTADADIRDLEQDADSLIEYRTHEGKHFDKAIAFLTDVGIITGNIEGKMRHGLTLDEILEKSEQGDFDLIVAGSSQISQDES